MQREDDEWISPSFNSYSHNKSAEIASRVAENDQFSLENFHKISENDEAKVNDEDDFEFSLVLKEDLEVPGDETKLIGKSIFPIFNRDLVNYFESEKQEKLDTINVPLRRLFSEDDEAVWSSSSEADEIESIPPGSYCVWKPKTVEASPSSCKKSKSTGFGSKRWKLRDLLRRSNSEGKDSFVFLTPKRKEDKKSTENGLFSSKKSTATPQTLKSAQAPARRMIYSPSNRTFMRGNETPNRSPKANSEMSKRKSYLPYRQDLVGFFTTVNTLGRNFSPRR